MYTRIWIGIMMMMSSLGGVGCSLDQMEYENEAAPSYFQATVFGDQTYIHDVYSQKIRVFQTQSGTLLWEHDTFYEEWTLQTVSNRVALFEVGYGSLVALSENSGEERWQSDVFFEQYVTFGRWIYGVSENQLVVLHMETGQELWREDYAGIQEILPSSEHVFLRIQDDSAETQSLYALDSATGLLRWSRNALPIQGAQMHRDESHWYYSYFDEDLERRVVEALDVRHGKTNWRYETLAKEDALLFWDADFSYVQSTEFSETTLIALKKETGVEAWRISKLERPIEKLSSQSGQVGFYSNLLLHDTLRSQVFAYDQATGALQWQQDNSEHFVEQLQWTSAGLHIETLSHQNSYVLDVETGESLWDHEPLWEPHARGYVDGQLYYGRNYELFMVDLKEGQTRWSFLIDQGIAQEPIAYQNQLLVLSTHGVLRSFDIQTGVLQWESRVSDFL